jgi:hypothetical protein
VSAVLDRVVRPPIVLFAYLVSRLRRIPGAMWLQRHSGLAIFALLVAALVALSFTMAQRTPQRVSLPQLAAGELAPMQTWIIVTGDLSAQPMTNGTFRYAMTDPASPDTTLYVSSEHELSVGRATVSGTLIGGDSRAPAGFPWIGQLRADPVLAREPDPPWLAIGLAAIALLIFFAARTSYPMFFAGAATPVPAPAHADLDVGVRRTWPPTDEAPTPGRVVLRAREPIVLASDAGAESLQLYSANSSYESGSLRWLRRSEPALALHPSKGDVLMSFASADDRDTALAGLLADATRQRLAR